MVKYGESEKSRLPAFFRPPLARPTPSSSPLPARVCVFCCYLTGGGVDSLSSYFNIETSCLGPKLRGLAFPPYLSSMGPAEVICTVNDGRSIPPALTDRTASPGSGCSAASFWQFQLLYIINVYNRPASPKSHMAGRAVYLADPCRHSTGLAVPASKDNRRDE